MTKITLDDKVYRINSAGKLARIREKRQLEDPAYAYRLTKDFQALYFKYFDQKDTAKIVFKELSTKLKEEGVRFNYQKIKGVIRIYWEGSHKDLYYTKSGYFRMERYDHANGVVKYYFQADDLTMLAEKLWKMRLMNRKFYDLLVK